jgi:hypothetical protein
MVAQSMAFASAKRSKWHWIDGGALMRRADLGNGQVVQVFNRKKQTWAEVRGARLDANYDVLLIRNNGRLSYAVYCANGASMASINADSLLAIMRCRIRRERMRVSLFRLLDA